MDRFRQMVIVGGADLFGFDPHPLRGDDVVIDVPEQQQYMPPPKELRDTTQILPGGGLARVRSGGWKLDRIEGDRAYYVAPQA